MTCEVELIEYTRSKKTGVTCATIKARYWRSIHAEVMTHRVFSRNAASSRAIPTLRIIRNTLRDMAGPTHWGANQSGMQASTELNGWRRWLAVSLWKLTGFIVLFMAYIGMKAGMHKQTINRMIEPWTHITVLITSTQWNNFLELRTHKDAQPEFRELASKIQKLLQHKSPRFLGDGEWHMPFVTDEEKQTLSIQDQLMLSVPRCASLSYDTVDGLKMTPDRAKALYDKLITAEPLHASPAEHQGQYDEMTNLVDHLDFGHEPEWKNPQLHGNLLGMIQYRKTLPREFFRD